MRRVQTRSQVEDRSLKPPAHSARQVRNLGGSSDRFSFSFQEPFPEREALEEHALSVHQVPREGLQRLVTLVEGCQWLNKARTEQQLKTPSKEVEEADVEKMDTEESNEVASIGAISEKHVYKYRCSQCSLAFKTQEKLETHSQYHQIRDSTKCKLCDRNFRTVAALLKHIDTGHSDTAGDHQNLFFVQKCSLACSEGDELEQYRQSLLSNPLLKAGLTNQVGDKKKASL